MLKWSGMEWEGGCNYLVLTEMWRVLILMGEGILLHRSGTIVRYTIITNSTVTVTVSDSTGLFIVFKTTNKYFSIQVVTV